jgi:hypothetical protein
MRAKSNGRRKNGREGWTPVLREDRAITVGTGKE